ncbi:amidase family protein, partial [Ascidiaceihabitans sp.]
MTLPLKCHTRDTVGTLARSVRDIALMDNVLSGEHGGAEVVDLSQVTLGVPKDRFFDDLESAVAAAIEKQLSVLGKAGAKLVDVSFEAVWEHNDA